MLAYLNDASSPRNAYPVAGGFALIGERRACNFLIVRRSNFAGPGSDGWSRNHDGKPTKSAAASD